MHPHTCTDTHTASDKSLVLTCLRTPSLLAIGSHSIKTSRLTHVRLDILALFGPTVDSLPNEEADHNCLTLKMSCHTHLEQETSSLIFSGEWILVTNLPFGARVLQPRDLHHICSRHRETGSRWQGIPLTPLALWTETWIDWLPTDRTGNGSAAAINVRTVAEGSYLRCLRQHSII